jgi:NAD(P)H-dependent FMN reductase
MTSSINSRPIRLLAISGSARTGSYNRQLVELAARKAQAQGAEVTLVDLRELGMPIYDEDWADAHGKPTGALKLRELFVSHDGLLLSCPEYNALPTPLLLNAFDWMSTLPAQDGLPGGGAITAGKPVGLMAASPGAYGGIRALPIVRTWLSTNFAMVVVPEQLALSHADQQVGDPNGLKSPQMDQVLDKVVASVIRQATWRVASQA